MNKQRKAQVTKSLEAIAAAQETMLEALAKIKDIRDDMAESLDNMSDGARNGERGQEMEMDASALDEMIDSIDAFDLKAIINEAAANLDLSAPEMPEANLSEVEMLKRRQARLPKWAKDRISKAEEMRDKAVEQASTLFGEPTGDPQELTIGGYHTTLDGKLLPTKIINVPHLGLRLCVQRVPCTDKEQYGLEIMAQRDLTIRPVAGNMAFIQGGKF